MDYWRWAPELDLVVQDHYLTAHRPATPHVELAFVADLTRGSRGGRPWLLMEHSTSAVNWQPRNLAKAPGQLRRNSLAHVARGADAVCFFQWRARGPARRSSTRRWCRTPAPTPRSGARSVEPRRRPGALAEVAGTRVRGRVAILVRLGGAVGRRAGLRTPRPTSTYLDRAPALYGALWDAGRHRRRRPARRRPRRLPAGPRADPVPGRPTPRAAHLGGTSTAAAPLLVTYFSGIVDENDHVRLGGYPGAFRDLLGVRTEEFFPLRQGETVRLDGGFRRCRGRRLDRAAPPGAARRRSRRYADGPLPGAPA